MCKDRDMWLGIELTTECLKTRERVIYKRFSERRAIFIKHHTATHNPPYIPHPRAQRNTSTIYQHHQTHRVAQHHRKHHRIHITAHLDNQHHRTHIRTSSYKTCTIPTDLHILHNLPRAPSSGIWGTILYTHPTEVLSVRAGTVFAFGKRVHNAAVAALRSRRHQRRCRLFIESSCAARTFF